MYAVLRQDALPTADNTTLPISAKVVVVLFFNLQEGLALNSQDLIML